MGSARNASRTKLLSLSIEWRHTHLLFQIEWIESWPTISGCLSKYLLRTIAPMMKKIIEFAWKKMPKAKKRRCEFFIQKLSLHWIRKLRATLRNLWNNPRPRQVTPILREILARPLPNRLMKIEGLRLQCRRCRALLLSLRVVDKKRSLYMPLKKLEFLSGQQNTLCSCIL